MAIKKGRSSEWLIARISEWFMRRLRIICPNSHRPFAKHLKLFGLAETAPDRLQCFIVQSNRSLENKVG